MTASNAANTVILLLAAWLSGNISAQAQSPALPQHTADTSADTVNIFPTPLSATVGTGDLRLNKNLCISIAANDSGAAASANSVADLLRRTHGMRVRVGTGAGQLRFVRQAGMAAESYRLDIAPSGATITASDDAGLFYGGISFWQLLSAAPGGVIKSINISDHPALRWRGAMLDSARHFQSPRFVRAFLDWMAAHKLNRFHWHLVDDQGWRVEIKAFPKLTEVGGVRRPATAPGAPPLPEHRGYYTQAELRDIVAYASARGISIIPEIDIPGHALSAIRAYHQWGMGVPVPPGTEADWGVFPWLYNTDEQTMASLETILAEVIAIFPGQYVHLGGDEAVKDQWRASPKIQQQMRTLGLSNENQLQSWFMGRFERFLARHGRQAIGWDEILEGNPPATTTIMSWRGISGGVEGANAGHDVILSPSPDLYLDHVQGLDSAEPPGRGGVISLSSILAFDPLPDAITPAQEKHILGLQGNLWTEHVRTEERAAWMAFPRLSAVAEVGWTGRGSRDMPSFLRRLRPQLERLHRLGLAPAQSAWKPRIAAMVTGSGQQAQLTLDNEAGLPMMVALNDQPPAPYTQPIPAALPVHITAWSMLDGRAMGGETAGRTARDFNARNIRDRDSMALTPCSSIVELMLEDDFPAGTKRPRYRTDIMKPCWIYKGAELDGVNRIAVEVGQIPFNFQIGADIDKIRFPAPQSPVGEFLVRVGSCDAPVIATLPLVTAAANPGVSRLEAELPGVSDRQDLCLTYSAKGVEPLWVINSVHLWDQHQP